MLHFTIEYTIRGFGYQCGSRLVHANSFIEAMQKVNDDWKKDSHGMSIEIEDMSVAQVKEFHLHDEKTGIKRVMYAADEKTAQRQFKNWVKHLSPECIAKWTEKVNA